MLMLHGRGALKGVLAACPERDTRILLEPALPACLSAKALVQVRKPGFNRIPPPATACRPAHEHK